MMKNFDKKRFLTFLKILVTRVYVLYVAVFLFAWFFVDIKLLKAHCRGASLSRLMPRSFAYLKEVERRAGQNIDQHQLDHYLHYYENVMRFLRDKSEGHATAAFCYYYAGKPERAQQAYTTAILMDPFFITFSYNLAVIYSQKGAFYQARPLLLNAINSSFEKNINFITTSKVYFPYLEEPLGRDFPERLRKKLVEVYENSYKLLVLSYYKEEAYEKAFYFSQEAMTSAYDFPDKAFFQYMSGRVLYEMGKFGEAAYFFKQYLDIDQGNAEAFYYLSKSLEQTGHTEMAQRAWQAYLNISKDKNRDFLDVAQYKLRIF